MRRATALLRTMRDTRSFSVTTASCDAPGCHSRCVIDRCSDCSESRARGDAHSLRSAAPGDTVDAPRGDIHVGELASGALACNGSPSSCSLH